MERRAAAPALLEVRELFRLHKAVSLYASARSGIREHCGRHAPLACRGSLASDEKL